MARGTADTHEKSIAEAADALGMTQQGVGQWADRAPADAVKLRRGRRYLIWPVFPVWYRQQLQSARERPTNLEDARARKLAAEAELAELELEQARGDVVPVQVFRDRARQIVSTLRAQLLSTPGRYAARTVGLATLVESQRAWDAAVRDILTELAEGPDGDGGD